MSSNGEAAVLAETRVHLEMIPQPGGGHLVCLLRRGEVISSYRTDGDGRIVPGSRRSQQEPPLGNREFWQAFSAARRPAPVSGEPAQASSRQRPSVTTAPRAGNHAACQQPRPHRLPAPGQPGCPVTPL
jgi:hypothetical protein